MKKQKIETGKIVGTHGVRGGLRVQPWCDTPDFLCGFKKLYIKNPDGYFDVKVRSSKPHGNIVIMEIEGVLSIEDAEKLRNKVLYLDRADLNLEEDRYLISDLLGCIVFDVDTEKELGKITDVSKTGANDVWHIIKEEKEFLIPVIEDVVIKVDIDNNRVLIRPLKGIFDYEN